MTRVALTLLAFSGFMMLIILPVIVLFFSEPVYNVPCYDRNGAVINGLTCTSEKVNETGEVIIISSLILFIPILSYNIYKENDEERKIRGGDYY